MAMQYKPTKPKKEKTVKAPKAPKAEKAMKFNSTVQTVKSSKPAKAPKVPKPEKASKAFSIGRPGKVQTDKPMKVEKAKRPSIFSKLNPKLILGGALVLVAVIAVIVLTVVLPAVKEHGEQIKHIIISSTPDKTIYLIGEKANYDGLRVQVTRNNGETFTVRAGKCQITGFDSSVAEENQTITVDYQGFTATFSIKVEQPPKPTPVLKGIKLMEMPKTAYKVGEWLDTNGGMLLREYVDGTTAEITLVNSYIFGWEDVNGPGTYELTVKYKENGVTATTTYTITVTG